MARKTRRTARAVVLGRARAAGPTQSDRLLSELASTDGETRCTAALGLGRHGGAEAVEPLEEAALGDDLELAACARTALVALWARQDTKDQDARKAKAALSSPYAAERVAAVRAVGRDPGALGVLVPMLEVEIDRKVLCTLVITIGRLDDGSARQAVLGTLQHRDECVRAAAVEALWGAQDEEAGYAALPMARDPAEKVRAAALILLIRRGHETSRAMAGRVLASTRRWMQLTALFALGGMTEAWARQMLIQYIRDTGLNPLVRTLAREAVGIAGIAKDGAGRKKRAGDAEDTVFTDLTRHLEPLPDVASIHAALGSPDPLLRVHGLQNSKRFGEAEMIPLLSKQVDFETDPLVLATLVKALGRMGGVSQVNAIRGFLEHEDERVRANAVEAMALASPGPELDALLKNLLAEDEGPRLRKQAAAQLFASNPASAVEHFRGLVLSGDAATRAGALNIIASVQDDRLGEVLREALRDQRREVYEPAVAMLAKAGRDWPAAAELLAAFRKGGVAGEVVEDRPVGALLSCEMNSSRAADRVRAMGLLAAARDPRVTTVLELNMSSRDPEVAHVASRVLRDRHRTLTLPALYQKIGEVYGARMRAGELVVPQEVANRLVVAETDEEEDPDRLRWLGKALYDAFDDDVELEAELRGLCLEVRGALEQLGSIVSPVSRPERMAAVAAALAQGRREPAMDTGPEDVAPRRGGAWGVIAVVTLVAGLSMASWMADAPVQEAEGSGPVDGSTRMLDAMALESKPDRFKERFRGRGMTVTGRVVSVGDSGSLDLRAGSVLFRVKLRKPAILPAGLRMGQPCEVTGTVVEMDGDGSISLEATQAAVRET